MRTLGVKGASRRGQWVGEGGGGGVTHEATCQLQRRGFEVVGPLTRATARIN